MTGLRVRTRPGDDTGSLALAILLTTLALGLVALLGGIVLAQQKTTRFDTGRVDALSAAQTGLDVALSQLRAATNADGSGDRAKLPCTVAGVVSGGSAATYSVNIYHLATSPPSGDAAWAAAHQTPCTPGTGPASQPGFALLESTGTAATGGTGRTLLATYAFHSNTDGNIAGGLIHAYRTGPDLCLAAPALPVSAGDNLRLSACDSTSALQKFSYEASLNLVLVASRTAGLPRGMCLDAPVPVPVTAVVNVKFQPCAASPLPRQQWGQNDYSAFQGTSDGVNLNDFCFKISSPGSAGSAVVLGYAPDPDTSVNCYVDWTETKTFYPDSNVGSGRAGAATNQLVNFEQFARCIDVTGDDVTTDFLVVFPCKQKPSGRIQWNQEWFLPAVPAGYDGATGRIYTTFPGDGKTYCLTSPGSTAPSRYVTVTRCPTGSTTPANQTWTVRPNTGSNYATSYRIESTYGAGSSSFCLTPTDVSVSGSDVWTETGQPIGKVVLAACNDTKLQKWNASVSIVRSPVKDVVER